MAKVPYKVEPCNTEDDDYEIVSFEDFCDTSPASKTDLLTLNDNINYRLYYESDKNFKYAEDGETSSKSVGTHTETSLNGPKNATYKRKLSFAPFGRTDKTGHGSLFSGVLPKPRTDGESTRDHRYERFSPRRGWLSRAWEQIINLFPGILAIMLLCALCVAAWWAVGGALGGGWGDERYRKLWERVHPDDVKSIVVPEKSLSSEYRYHDHNNLSTKNKSNGTDVTRKKDTKKNLYIERPLEVLKELCGHVTDNMRFDCYPQDGANESGCIQRGCCWKATNVAGAPYCFYPPQYDTYHFVNSTENMHGMSVYYGRGRDAGYPGQFATARFDFYYLSDYILQIKISDADNKRFEPPYPEIPTVGGSIANMRYRVQVDSSLVGFKVVRTTDNVTIINSQGVGGVILSEQFLQLSAVLSAGRLYGLGEKQAPLVNDMDWNTFTLFNSDQPPVKGRPLYGTHPFYLALEKTGDSHGMLLLNSNAMDIVLQPTPAITYRTTGGILDLYVLLGPSPADVLAQYTELVGRPFMPPYWSLGFHLCKFNYGSLNETMEVWKRNRDAGLPFDVQWNDLDYMSTANDFTYDRDKFAGLPAFARTLHDAGMHYMLLFDPGVSAAEKPGEYPPYDRGLDMNVFIKNSTDQPFIGKVWNPVSTVWPDFTHPNASLYWREMLHLLHTEVPFDGAWIDMNEPSNFISGSAREGECQPEHLPYRPRGLYAEGLKHKSLCMDAVQFLGSHYDLHNLYALTEAIATNNALQDVRGKRPFVISRASFPGLGRVAGHWSGDIDSSWSDMRMSIPDLLSFSLFGVPMMGADICGFRSDATPELCKRWMQLGAFYPFSRNHNSDQSKPQDPAHFGGDVLAASVRALRLRYLLLPYYYTLFWRAHVAGETVARPLFVEFPKCPKVYDIDTQFMIGPHVMITPILEQGKNSTRAFYPCRHSWYSLSSGRLLTHGAAWLKVTDEDMVAIRGGAVIPVQEARGPGPITTTVTRSSPLQLLVVPTVSGAGPAAAGLLYWDDGDSINSYEEKKYTHIEFTVQDNELRSGVKWWGHGVPPVDTVTVLGLNTTVVSVSVDSKPTKFTYDANAQTLVVPNINLSLDKEFKIKWTHKK